MLFLFKVDILTLQSDCHIDSITYKITWQSRTCAIVTC